MVGRPGQGIAEGEGLAQEEAGSRAGDHCGKFELLREAGKGMRRLASCGSWEFGEYWLGLHQKISWHREAFGSGELGCMKEVGRILIGWRVQKKHWMYSSTVQNLCFPLHI